MNNYKHVEPKSIIVCGGDETGLLAVKLAKLRLENPDFEVVTINEAKERGIDMASKFVSRFPSPEVEQMFLRDNFIDDGKSARNKRRELERKSKKKKKYGY